MSGNNNHCPMEQYSNDEAFQLQVADVTFASNEDENDSRGGSPSLVARSLPNSNGEVDYLLNPLDHSILKDHNALPITVGRMLATKPLRQELLTRPGPGGKKLTYMSGESVTRTLNEVFGFDGWSLKIIKTERTACEKEIDKKTGGGGFRWTVAYIAHVRITHTKSGTFKEDLGAGDSIDRHLPTAIQHAMKASITDAVKRSARHFGDKLGNILYQGSFSMNTAPKTLTEAFDQYDKERSRCKFNYNNNANTNSTNKENQKKTENDSATVHPVTVSSCATISINNSTLSKPDANRNVYDQNNRQSDGKLSNNNNNSTTLYKTDSNRNVVNHQNNPLDGKQHMSKNCNVQQNIPAGRNDNNNGIITGRSLNYNTSTNIAQGWSTDSLNANTNTSSWFSKCVSHGQASAVPHQNNNIQNQQPNGNAVASIHPHNETHTLSKNVNSTTVFQIPQTPAEGGLQTSCMFGNTEQQQNINTDDSIFESSWIDEISRPVTSTGRNSNSQRFSYPPPILTTPSVDESNNNRKRPVPVTVQQNNAYAAVNKKKTNNTIFPL